MKLKLVRKAMIDYPSASAVEFSNEVLYVIGDDINYILCMDAAWNSIKEIKLFEFSGTRIPKPDKPDLECAAVIDDVLYVAGSGSRSPERDVAFIIQLADDSVKKISTASFYSLFRDRGLVAEMNIEGFTACRDRLLFFNRGNTLQPNHLLISDRRILKKHLPDKFKAMPVQIGALHNIPLGISGACYDEANDILFLTASAENTGNAYDDGEIIGSVLAVVYNAYSKLNGTELVIDELFALEDADAAFAAQKIESICITAQEGRSYSCVLAADNDDGKSMLFEVEVTL